jgi:hypothetical protein
MGYDNTQQLNKHGPAFFFLQDPFTSGSVTTTFPWADLGTIEERTVKNDPQSEVIYDERDGTQQAVGEAQNRFDPVFELTTPNSSVQMVSFFLRALPGTALARTGSAKTTVANVFSAGSPCKIVDATGTPVAMVASIQAVELTAGSVSLVKGVDFEYTQGDLDRGFIYFLPTSTNITGIAMPGTISYTDTTYSNVNNLLTMLSGPSVITGYGELWLASNQGQRRQVIQDRWAITVPDLQLSANKITRVKPTVRRLYAPTATTPSQVLLAKG